MCGVPLSDVYSNMEPEQQRRRAQTVEFTICTSHMFFISFPSQLSK